MNPLEINFASEDEEKKLPSFSASSNDSPPLFLCGECITGDSSPPPMMMMMPKRQKMMKKKKTPPKVRPMVFVKPASTVTPTAVSNTSKNDNMRRSQLYVEGICCSTEVPIVTDILNSAFQKQVQNVRINVTHRILYVDHDETQLSIETISQKLADEGFEAQILNINNIVESSLKIPSLSSLQEIEPILVRRGWTENDMLITIELDSKSKIVKIKHDIHQLSIQYILEVIQESGYPDATLEIDGSLTSKVPIEKHKLHLNVILSGIFWVMSLLDFTNAEWYVLIVYHAYNITLSMSWLHSKRLYKYWNLKSTDFMNEVSHFSSLSQFF